MKNYITITLAVFFCFTSIYPALALSESQHKELLLTSSAFAKADKRLNAVLKQIKKIASREQYAAMLKDQKRWNSRRDAEAQALRAALDDKISLADSYALPANRRADKLEIRYLSVKADLGEWSRHMASTLWESELIRMHVENRAQNDPQEPDDFTGTWVLLNPKHNWNWKRRIDTYDAPQEELYWISRASIVISSQLESMFTFNYNGTYIWYTGDIEDTAIITSPDEAVFTLPEEDCMRNKKAQGVIHFEFFNNILRVTTENELCLGFADRVSMDGTYMR